MIELKNLQVSCLDLDYLKITWEVKQTSEDLLSYYFEILRSEATHGPFDLISPPFTDRYEFRDYIAPRKHEWRLFHYKIRVTNKQNQESVEYGPVSAQYRPPLDALEILRLETLLFREYIGRPCILLPVRSFGQVCGQCYDIVTHRTIASNCPVCYSTGYTGGFLNPVIVYPQIDPHPKMQQNAPPITQQQAMSTGRLPADIYIKPKDILIEQDNKRWRVGSVTTTERLRFPVRQELQLVKIPIGDIEYSFDISWPDVEAGPRNYEFSGRV